MRGTRQLDATLTSQLDRGWSAFRRTPWWAQALGWVIVWPVLAGLFFSRWERLGRAALPVGVVFAVLFTPAWVAGFSGSTPEEPPADVAVGDVDEDPQPVPSPEPTAPTPTPEATPTPDPSPTADEEATARQATATAPDGDLVVHFIDVGQADATLLLTSEVAVLVDTGDWRRRDVVPYLRSQGVERLDVVIVTHPHADHIGQFDQVLAGFDVSEVWWSGATHTTQTFDRAVTALEQSDALYEEPRAGDVTAVGPLLFEFVNPPDGANFSDLHDSGLAFRVSYGDVRFLFTGDAESQTEARMVRTHRGALAADIYQVGHHGSRTSTTEGFLAAVSPQVAVYSAGQGNQYGHPHDEPIQRLLDTGVEVYGTDVHGTVIVTTDGQSWTISTARDATIAAPRGPPPAAAPPAVEEEEPPPPEPESGCAAGEVNINSAGVAELQRIIHIGPARAEEMIRIRPFRSVDDMRRITGIADARLRDIKEQGLACVP
jgi:competence protein ComEC